MDGSSLLFSWKLEPLTLLGLFFAGLVYQRGWRALQRSVPHRFPRWRRSSFFWGLGLSYVAIASPVDVFAGFLLRIHMVQHLLLTMLIPPLLLLGAPWLPILRGLPRSWVRDVGQPLLNGVFWKRSAAFLSHPIISWLLFVGSNILWHLPFFYEMALRSDRWHAVEHGCFLGTALLFWWQVILPFPGRTAYSRWLGIPYLLLADLQNTALGAFLSFYDHPLYPIYQTVPRLWGIDVMSDQTVAGLIMWVPGSIAFLLPAGWLALHLLSPKSHSSRLKTAGNVSLSRVAKPSWKIRLARTPARRILQSLLLFLALIVIYDGLFGPKIASLNLAGVLPWTYWRGLSVIALLTVGNIFCSACPFVLARDLARRAVPGAGRRIWPRAWRNKWAAVGLLATFLWAYEVFDLWNRPMATALLIAAYFASAIGVDLVFRGASFCQYLCPIGQYHFAFSTQASAEIAVVDPQICARCTTHDCLRGNERDRGCELHLFQPAKAGNMDCTGCLDCVRACPVDNVDLVAVVPARDLASDRFRSTVGRYSRRPDLAALFGLFIVEALVNALGMISPVTVLTSRIADGCGLSRKTVVSLLFVGILFFIPLLAWLVAVLSRKLGGAAERARILLRSFAAAFVPLGASVWAAHFLFHLATGAFTIIPVTQRFLGDLGFSFAGKPDWSWIGFQGDGIMGIELILLNTGAIGTIYLLWKISQREFPSGRRLAGFLPWSGLLLLLFSVAVWTLFQPMDMRGTLLSVH